MEVATATADTEAPRCRTRRLRTAGLLCIPLAALTAVSLLGQALSFSLVRSHPVVLMVLTPRTPYMIAAATQLPLGPFVAIAVVRLMVADPLHFALGRRYGSGAFDGMAQRLPTFALSVVRRYGAWVALMSPTAKVLLVAGAAGLDARRVFIAAAVGTSVRVVAVWAAAHSLPGAGELAAAVTPIVAAATPVAMMSDLVRRRRQRRAARSRAGHPCLTPPLPAMAAVPA